jgi:8-oxo-dGTP pyrophosphatase MutT (NUDIX family)
VDQHRCNVGRIARALEAPARASSDYDLELGPGPRRARALRPASVLVPLVPRGAGLGVVLTRRPMWLKHHPGHVAFPGGKQEAGDPTPLAAALREAEEEIGLAPSQVEVLGAFDSHETVTAFCVTPFVGLVSPGFRPRPDRAEVDEVFEVPLAFALDPANFQLHHRRWRGLHRRYYAIPYGPHYIWGATARILKALADRMREA